MESTGGQTTPSHPVCHLADAEGLLLPLSPGGGGSFCAGCGSTPDVFLNVSPLSFLKQGLSLNLELSAWAKPASQ